MDATHSDDNDDDNNNNDVDIEPISGPRMKTEIWFPCWHRKSQSFNYTQRIKLISCPETGYPSSLAVLAIFVDKPDLPHALQTFIYQQNHPNSSCPSSLDNSFDGPICVFHSAKVQFYAPSDLCGAGGMLQRLSVLTQIMLVHLTLTQFSSLLVMRRLWMDFWPHAFYYYLPSLILSIRKTEISLMSYCVLIALKPKFSLILT